VKDYGHNLPGLVANVRAQNCASRDEADVLVMTVHRAKGLEFDQVVLEDDFEELLDEHSQIRNMTGDEMEQKVNMLYVAMTRAITALEMNQNLQTFLAVWKKQLAGQPFQVGTPAPAGSAPDQRRWRSRRPIKSSRWQKQVWLTLLPRTRILSGRPPSRSLSFSPAGSMSRKSPGN
jgi:hypothetical protein